MIVNSTSAVPNGAVKPSRRHRNWGISHGRAHPRNMLFIKAEVHISWSSLCRLPSPTELNWFTTGQCRFIVCSQTGAYLEVKPVQEELDWDYCLRHAGKARKRIRLPQHHPGPQNLCNLCIELIQRAEINLAICRAKLSVTLECRCREQKVEQHWRHRLWSIPECEEVYKHKGSSCPPPDTEFLGEGWNPNRLGATGAITSREPRSTILQQELDNFLKDGPLWTIPTADITW